MALQYETCPDCGRNDGTHDRGCWRYELHAPPYRTTYTPDGYPVKVWNVCPICGESGHGRSAHQWDR